MNILSLHRKQPRTVASVQSHVPSQNLAAKQPAKCFRAGPKKREYFPLRPHIFNRRENYPPNHHFLNRQNKRQNSLATTSAHFIIPFRLPNSGSWLPASDFYPIFFVNTNDCGHMMVYATMTNRFCVFILFGALSAGQLVTAADGPPVWAYGTSPEAAAAAPPRGAPDMSVKHLPDSQGAFTKAQIGDRFAPADWYPGDHPAMPEIVSHGRKPEVWACGLCHYPNGKGRPENAGVSGLPVRTSLNRCGSSEKASAAARIRGRKTRAS